MAADRWQQLNSNRAVQHACRARAERIASRARSITKSEGGAANITVRTGIRPKGRAFAYVETDRPDEEYGGKGVKRTAAVARAAREA